MIKLAYLNIANYYLYANLYVNIDIFSLIKSYLTVDNDNNDNENKMSINYQNTSGCQLDY